MRSVFNSFLICFSMYSIIPMPNVSWKSGVMRYIFIFLPFIGIFIGITSILWYKFAVFMGVSPILYGVVAAALPVLLSGAIHIDGFIDTCDAFSSHGSFEKKSEILKDPHVGAFGIIYCVIYFLIIFGLYCEFFIRNGSLWLLFFSFFVARTFGALASVTFSPSKKSGLLYAFTVESEKNKVTVILCGYIILLFIFLYFMVSFKLLLVIFIVFILYFLWFKRFCRVSFGGISGDLAGFYISTCELLFIFFSVLA